MSFSRAQRGGFADWWMTIDRVALCAVLGLITIGLMLAFAASPAATGGPLSGGDFRYALKQVTFAFIAAVIFAWASLLTLRQIRIVAALAFSFGLIGSTLVLFTGEEVLGAKRWIDIGFMTFQPSEFLKPGFAILAAAILAERKPLPLPGPAITLLLVALPVAVLLLQPDVGQTGLLIALWGALLFFHGVRLLWIWLMASGAAGFIAFAYIFFDHVRNRIDQFLHPTEAGYQVGLALKAFEHGGFMGVGPGAGTVKYRIPDAHSDFIYAVAGEEFGLALCAVIAGLFGLLTVRLFLRSANARDPFAQLAGAGLATVCALQAFINMGVAINLLPAKGMTLPFISYGGSSLFSVALTMGLALAVTRQRPQIPAMRSQSFYAGARA